MRLPLLIAILLLNWITSIAQVKNNFGRYTNIKIVVGDEFIFYDDSTFVYTCIGKKASTEFFFDSSAGKFSLIGDTVYLSYQYNNYYPLIIDTKTNGDDKVEPKGFFSNRPQKLFLEGENIFKVDNNTGQIDRKNYLRKTSEPRLTLLERDKLLLEGKGVFK